MAFDARIPPWIEKLFSNLYRANAVKVVEALGVERVLFLPDEYLAKYVASQTSVEIIPWHGHCEVHERFTGAEVEKTATQVRRYGGTQDAYDPCYHQACDSFSPLADGADVDVYTALQAAYGSRLVGNVNTFALDTNADAIAHAVATYSYSTQSVNGEQPPLRGKGAKRAKVLGTEEADAA